MTYVREIASTPTVTNPAPENFATPDRFAWPSDSQRILIQ